MQRQASGRGSPIEPVKQLPRRVLATWMPTTLPLALNTTKWSIFVGGLGVASADPVHAASAATTSPPIRSSRDTRAMLARCDRRTVSSTGRAESETYGSRGKRPYESVPLGAITAAA